MSTYTQYGDDVLFGGTKFKNTILGKIITKSPVVSAAKFVIHPIKETKAAIKTIARFDPTAKTAKYGNITKGVLAASALTAAAVLTGGGALAVAGGIAGAAGTGLKIGMTPVRKPAPRITPTIEQNVATAYADPGTQMQAAPLNTYVAQGGGGSGAPQSSNVEAYSGSAPQSSSSSTAMILGVVAVVGIAVLLMSKKSKSSIPSLVTA